MVVRKRLEERESNLLDYLCGIMLCIMICIEKMAALYLRCYRKYPKATTAITAVIWFYGFGTLGKSDMLAEIARYGN